MINAKQYQMKQFVIGSRELPLCNSTHFSTGSIIWSFTSLRNMQANPIDAEICEIFISYCLHRFHNCDGTHYGCIVSYSYDKNVELHNF